jgi:predicted dehydrogenase
MAMTFGLLGTGYWAGKAHAAGLAAAPDARLAGVWGRDLAKAEALASQYGVAAYTDLDALLGEVEAVTIALPPPVQASVAVRAAKAGKHLLLDKPIALSIADADEIVAAVDGSGVASVVFVTRRYAPRVVDFLNRAVATGGFHSARATMLASIFQPGNPYGKSAWRLEKGGLWDIGPHALSLLLPVLGPVAEATTVDGPYRSQAVTLRHDGGAVSVMTVGLDTPLEARGSEFVFEGDHGQLTAPTGPTDEVAALAAAATQLIRAATTPGRPHPCDVRFGWDITAILAAAEESARAGTAISVQRR